MNPISFKLILHVLVSVTVVFVLSMREPAIALMIERGLSELTTDAELIIEGRVTSIVGEWSNHPKAAIVTKVRIVLLDVIKGDLNIGDEVNVQILGGEIPEQDIGLRVSDQPNFQLNERVIIFLKKQHGDNIFLTVGNFQGKLIVVDENVSYKGQWVDLNHFKKRILNIVSDGMDIK